jgi:hypothetical protein
MKKFVLILVFALVLIGATVAYADDSSLIGQAVQGVFPVYVNGSELTTQAIVIDGVSYLPTRAVAEALGANVSFTGMEIDVATTTQVTTQATETQEAQQVKYTFQSSVVATQYDQYAINDGSLYLPIKAFINDKLGWDSSNPDTLCYADKNVNINVDPSYAQGCNAYRLNGRAMVNISVLGYTYSINGNVITIQ